MELTNANLAHAARADIPVRQVRGLNTTRKALSAAG